MDSYVIRIYRRDEQNPLNIIGLVEDVMIQETRPFKNFNELWEILRQGEKKKGGGRKRGRKNNNNCRGIASNAQRKGRGIEQEAKSIEHRDCPWLLAFPIPQSRICPIFFIFCVRNLKKFKKIKPSENVGTGDKNMSPVCL